MDTHDHVEWRVNLRLQVLNQVVDERLQQQGMRQEAGQSKKRTELTCELCWKSGTFWMRSSFMTSETSLRSDTGSSPRMDLSSRPPCRLQMLR